MSRYLTLITLILSLAVASSARILNVPDEWEVVQEAVSAAGAGDTVLVAPGNYQGALRIEGPSITLAGHFLLNGDRDLIEQTVIDADRGACVIRIDGGANQRSRIVGLTLQNGRHSYGAGISCRENTRPTFEDMVIRLCEADNWGGGIYAAENVVMHATRVQFLENHAEVHGGGAGGFRADSLFFEGCVFSRNSADQGGSALINSIGITSLKRCLFERNEGSAVLYGLDQIDFSHIENCTFVGNTGIQLAVIFGSSFSIDVSIVNTIFWDQVTAIRIEGGSQRQLHIDHSIVRGGQERVRVGDDLDWGEGNLEDDPLFFRPDLFDYNLAENSPCIDAGNPDSPPDPDGSHADIGFYPFVNQFAVVAGRVTDRATNQPIIGATVRAFEEERDIFTLQAGEDGEWNQRLHLPRGAIDVTIQVEAPRYFKRTIGPLEFAPEDELFFNLPLEPLLVETDPERVSMYVEEGGSDRSALSIYNGSQEMLRWSASLRGINVSLGEPWTLADTFNFGNLVEDDRLHGVAYVNGNFYIPGANGEDTNVVYIFDRSGEYIDQFPQHGTSRYGMKDLTWDGDLLWGSGDSVLYGFRPDGELISTISVPVIYPVENVAWDPLNQVFWVSGITTDIIGINRDGEEAFRISNRDLPLRKYGLAWYPEDPDDMNLYILRRPAAGPTVNHILKMNIVTGDTMTVGTFEMASFYGLTSLCISHEFGRLGGWTLLSVANRAVPDGNDFVTAWHLTRAEWLTFSPDSGSIRPNDVGDVILDLNTSDGEGWQMERGIYDLEMVIGIEGFDGDMRIPVEVRVGVPPDEVGRTGFQPVDGFGLKGVYPNPFNNAMTIRYSVGKEGRMTLKIFDLSGREVAILKDEVVKAGSYSATFKGDGLATGVYLARLEAGGANFSMKIVCIK